MSRTTINAKEALNDIRAGMTDASLMTKYKLTAKGLDSLYRKLLEAQLIAPSEVQERMSRYSDTLAESDILCPFCHSLRLTDDRICPDCGYRLPKGRPEGTAKKWRIRGRLAQTESRKPRIRAQDAVKAISAGMTDSQLMEKYNLSPKGLQSLLKKLLRGNFIEASELEDRLAGFAAAVELSLVSFPSQEAGDSLDTPTGDPSSRIDPGRSTASKASSKSHAEADTVIDERIRTRHLWHPDYVQPNGADEASDSETVPNGEPSSSSNRGGKAKDAAAQGEPFPSMHHRPRMLSPRVWALIGMVATCLVIVGAYFGLVYVQSREPIPVDSVKKDRKIPQTSAFGLPNSPHLLWSLPTDGPVRTRPCVTEGLAIVGSDDGYVYAADIRTGLPKWHFKTDGLVRSSAVAAEQTAFVGSTDKRLYALRVRNGKPRWWFEAFDAITSSPCIAGNLVCFGCDDGKLYALDRLKGKEV